MYNFKLTTGTYHSFQANAIATALKKKILLINFPNLGTNEAGAIVKMVFREAKINDAIVFFDECESIFKTREHGSNQVNMMLTELERFARRDSAEDFCRLDALLCTATAWIFIPARCFAIP